jgi:hypothetical protein
MPDALSRRAFLGTAAAGALAAGVRGAANPATEDDGMQPVRYWMHGFGGEPADTARALRDAGFHVAVAGGAAVIEAVNEAGMESWLCGGAFGLGKYGEGDGHKAIDITGAPQVWFGSGSPNSPALREQNLESYQDMAETDGVAGILVDGCRFASPASGIAAFFTDFGPHSEKKAAELGYDWPRMRRDVGALHELVRGGWACGPGRAEWLGKPVAALEWLTRHPGVLDWFRFRTQCSTEHFKAIAEVIHGAGKRMGVYIFTPSLAPLVGQSYADLAPFVDVFAPMIYRNYPERPGIACLNWELTIIPEEMGVAGTPAEAALLELILVWTGLAGTVPDRDIARVQAAVPPEAVAHETAMARALLPPDKELAPIIYIDDPLMEQTARLVRDQGANGLNFFVYKDNWADLVRPAF